MSPSATPSCCCGRWRQRRVVVPGDLRDRIRQLVQPGVVPVPSVEHADVLVQHQAERPRGDGVGTQDGCGGRRVERRCGMWPAARTSPPPRARRPRSDLRHAALERPIPERTLGIRRPAARVDRGGPMSANQVERRLRFAGPRRQAFDGRARVVHRPNRRLRQADEARDRLGVAPAFEIVMIGADEVGEAGGLVQPLGGAHDQRHALDVVRQRGGIRQVVHRVGAQHEQRADLAAPELRPQLGQLRVAAGALVRRPRQIDGRAVGANRLVDEVAQRLDAHVLASRDDETAAARGPEPIGDRVERRIRRRRGQAIHGERGAGALRDLRGQVVATCPSSPGATRRRRSAFDPVSDSRDSIWT